MELIQRINSIANNYNCRTILIDFDNFVINIEGNEDQRAACMTHIKEQLGEYLIQEQPYISTIHGWPV